MSVPISQMWTVASYVLKNQLRGVKRYPLVLMLEPLFRCNLACAGCVGKFSSLPTSSAKTYRPSNAGKPPTSARPPSLPFLAANRFCIHKLKRSLPGLVKRKRYVYLCTNALKLEESLPKFKPSKYFSFSVHLDGPQPEHDLAVCREGTYDIAIQAIKAAKKAGFRVTTNSTFFDGTNPDRTRGFFDEMTKLGVEGMMISPATATRKP
ncbi:MAG: radical SAM protein [Pirellulales bacterium]